MYVPDQCPACGSKKHWKKVADAEGRPSTNLGLPPVPEEVDNLLKPLKLGYKLARGTANLATFGTVGRVEKRIKKGAQAILGNEGTYYCTKCGLKITYENPVEKAHRPDQTETVAKEKKEGKEEEKMVAKQLEDYLQSLNKEQLISLLLEYLPEEAILPAKVEEEEAGIPIETLVEEALDSIRSLSGHRLDFNAELDVDAPYYNSKDEMIAELFEPLRTEAYRIFRKYIPALLKQSPQSALQFYLEAFTELDEYNGTDAAEYDFLSELEGDLSDLIQQEYQKLEPAKRKDFYDLVEAELQKASEPVLVEYLKDLFEEL